MQDQTNTARDVYEHILDGTRVASLAGDYEAFSIYFTVPQDIETFHGTRSLKTDSEFRSFFDSVQAHYRRTGVTDVVHNCLEAAYKDTDTIQGVHEVRLMNGHTMMQAPFTVFGVLIRTRDGWKVTRSSYAIADSDEHNAALLGTSPTGY